MPSDKDKALLRILERVPSPVVIANPVTAKIIWVNRQLAEMYGTADAPQAIIGRSLFDFIEPPQLGKALADLGRVVAGQSPPPVTYQLRRDNGQYAAGQVSSVPLLFQGQPAMLSFVTDVSERERLVRDLTESEERYRSLIESSPSGVVVVAADGAVAYANSSLFRALGFGSATDLLGRSMYDFIHKDDRAAVREARMEMLTARRSYPATPVRLLRVDGSVISTTAASTVIRWEGGLATQTLMHDLGGGAP